MITDNDECSVESFNSISKRVEDAKGKKCTICLKALNNQDDNIIVDHYNRCTASLMKLINHKYNKNQEKDNNNKSQ